ncbi:hypothetical protein DEJ02_15005 [Curtobacterium sp. MCLR17_042]|nr:hypothetical protein DEJ02_15005 [Curtobacterium sp. MCLR17_042]
MWIAPVRGPLWTPVRALIVQEVLKLSPSEQGRRHGDRSEDLMSGYERAPGVAPVHITSYRARARAARRGWIVQSEDDVDRERFTFADLRARRGSGQ